MKKIVFLFLSWRLFLFIPLFVSQGFIEYRHGYPYTSLLYFLDDAKSIVSHFLLSPWSNFDGVYYLLIAANGYTVNAGFFPLLPLSLNLATSIFGQSAAGLPFAPIQYSTALLLVSVYFLIAIIVMYKLLRIDYKDKVSLWSIIFMLLFPTSFFFASIYSESLFLLLTVCSFYFARKRRWVLASICGSLLTATRFVGIAIIPALIYEFIQQEKTLIKTKALVLTLTFLGILTYMWFNLQKWGNAFYFIQAQGNLQNNRSVDSFILPFQTLFRYFKIITSVSPSLYEWWVALFEFSFFVFVLVILYIAWKKKVRFSYILFGLLCLFIPSLTGTLSGIPRYVLIIFPIFITMALIKNIVFKLIYCTISIILLFLFFMLFSKGYFIA